VAGLGIVTAGVVATASGALGTVVAGAAPSAGGGVSDPSAPVVDVVPSSGTVSAGTVAEPPSLPVVVVWVCAGAEGAPSVRCGAVAGVVGTATTLDEDDGAPLPPCRARSAACGAGWTGGPRAPGPRRPPSCAW
jgi:hypothetical protein